MHTGVLQHHCADFIFIFVYVCFCICAHACFSLSLLALIICRARPRAEVSGDPPTLIQSVCVCHVCVRVSVRMCDSVCLFMHRSTRCCSPASLLMTQQSTLMTRNTHSLLLCEPQLIIWSVKHRKIVSPPFKNKKEKSVRTQQGMRRNRPIRFHSSGVERRKAPITQISSGL